MKLSNPMLITVALVSALSGIYCVARKPSTPPPASVDQADVPRDQDEEIVLSKKTVKHIKVKKDNVVLVFDEIGANAADIANQINLKSNNSEPTVVLINSPGGSVLDGALIVSAIEASHTPVYTVCMQLCASMAAIIEGYGTQRYMVDRSILMHHPAAGGFQGTTGQMKARLTTLTRYVEKMHANIAARAGIELAQFLDMSNPELWLDAEDAVNIHLADSLVSLDLSELDQPALNSRLQFSRSVISSKLKTQLSDF